MLDFGCTYICTYIEFYHSFKGRNDNEEYLSMRFPSLASLAGNDRGGSVALRPGMTNEVVLLLGKIKTRFPSLASLAPARRRDRREWQGGG